ncbi:hypothetical protein POM88_034890 [Heracleum sosnowskyi]|uniref:Myb/SANT-like domain-containing protein n=1 Tax=Heracleum sosnowskyi TaxID=360622 RepID=A0AAD8HL62_9APIA|nr:hypothetical protein POM88_034890 [Heracleum sosnowskyi]
MDESSETPSQKPLRTYWKDDILTKTFLEACIHEVVVSGRQGSSLKPYSWENVGEVLKKTHNFDVEQRQMRNRYDYLRHRYAAWCSLRAKTGNHYNPTTNTFNFTDQEWKQHIQANKHVATLRTTPLIFPDLCKNLFDGAAATGVSGWGPSSKKNRTLDSSDDMEILGNEDIQSQSHMNSPFLGTHSNSSATFQDTTQSNVSDTHDEGERPKKKAKSSSKPSKSSQLEEKMASALDLMIQNNSGPSLQECKEKLNKIGWASTNPLRQMALGIFCESATYRTQWMLLEQDEIEPWVKMVSSKLGFNVVNICMVLSTM